MLQTIKKAWAIPELRKKIVFTALILLIFRIGNAIPVPYVDTGLLSTYLQQMSTTVLGLYDVMSGGAFASATVFALGVQPYHRHRLHRRPPPQRGRRNGAGRAFEGNGRAGSQHQP